MSKFRLRGRSRRAREARPDRIPLRAIVPNLVTSLAACAGITSISLSSEGRFREALWALLVACICDGMDGRIARLLKASSKLGAELDSLADFVNFGVAPAMFMFFWLTGGPTHVLPDGTELAPVVDGVRHTTPIVRVILACSLYYAMCDCFRLARFNTMLEQPPIPYWKHFFTGVPAPGGCWMVLSPAMLAMALDAKGSDVALQHVFRNPCFGMFMLLFVGALMASRLPTISLKAVRISRRYLLPTMVGLLLFVAFLVTNFWLTLGVAGIGYILTVPLVGLAFLKVRARYERAASASSAAD